MYWKLYSPLYLNPSFRHHPLNIRISHFCLTVIDRISGIQLLIKAKETWEYWKHYMIFDGYLENIAEDFQQFVLFNFNRFLQDIGFCAMKENQAICSLICHKTDLGLHFTTFGP